MHAKKMLLTLGLASMALALVTMSAGFNPMTSTNPSAFAQSEQKFNAKMTGKDEVHKRILKQVEQQNLP